MWNNDTVNSSNDYVFPTVRKKKAWDINMADWLRNWLKGNPQGKYVFWYNKETVTDAQIEKTKALFRELVQEFGNKAQFGLRDIHELPLVKANKDIFSDPRITYTKVDLLRILAALDYIENCTSECAFIYADVDKGYRINRQIKALEPLAMTEDNLFHNQVFQSYKHGGDDSTTPLDDLKKSGLIFRRGPENSFFIVSNHQPMLLDAMKKAVIEPMLLRAREYFIPTLDQYEKKFGIKPFTIAVVTQNKDKVPKEHQREVTELFRSIVNEVFHSMVLGPLAAHFLSLKGEVKLIYDQQKFPDIARAWLAFIPLTMSVGIPALVKPDVSPMQANNQDGKPNPVVIIQKLLDLFGVLEVEGSDSQSASAARIF